MYLPLLGFQHSSLPSLPPLLDLLHCCCVGGFFACSRAHPSMLPSFLYSTAAYWWHTLLVVPLLGWLLRLLGAALDPISVPCCTFTGILRRFLRVGAMSSSAVPALSYWYLSFFVSSGLSGSQTLPPFCHPSFPSCCCIDRGVIWPLSPRWGGLLDRALCPFHITAAFVDVHIR